MKKKLKTIKKSDFKQEIFRKLNFDNIEKYNCSICRKQANKLLAIKVHQDSEFLEYEVFKDLFSDCKNEACFWHVLCFQCFYCEFNEIFKLGAKTYEWMLNKE